jgi:signal transduction histidine kinase
MVLDPNAPPLSGKVCRFLARTHGLAYAQIAPDLTIVEASPNLKDLVTPNAREVVGQRLPDLFWEFVGAEEALQAILHGESASYRLEWVNFVLPDGTTTYLTFEVMAFNSLEPGDGLLFVIEDATAHGTLEQVVMQDRNELRLIQEQLAAANAELQRLLQFKSLMLSLASTELRTPLTTIRLYAGLMMKDASQINPEDRQRFVATIYGQANRLDALVNDLLDLDQIEAGRLKLNRVLCDLNAVVREAVDVMNTVVIPRHFNWQLDLPEAALLVPGDAEHLRRIVYNLLSNAARYVVGNGLIQISGRVEAGYVVLQVFDIGAVLSEAQLAQLLQPYYHIDGTRRMPFTSADLGLLIVKYLAESHGGHLTVSVQPNQGTIFAVRLPLK